VIVFGLQPDCKINDTNKFNICLDLDSTSGKFETWIQSFGNARDRWKQVIVEDGGLSFDASQFLEPDQYATEAPDMVDDIYIGGILAKIDGVDGVLGMVGPTHARTHPDGKFRPQSGFMTFDEEDVESMMADGTWTGVILHEMGHVLGIGTVWIDNDLHISEQDEYLGNFVKEEWANLGCSGKLPVETDGGEGTAGSHWDEECLNRELMTGIVDEDMSLSTITVASLRDMGYGVDYSAADPYDISMLEHPAFFRCWRHSKGIRDRLRHRETKVRYCIQTITNRLDI
jgi:hypothetical protein